jgi:hypothetical protein
LVAVLAFRNYAPRKKFYHVKTEGEIYPLILSKNIQALTFRKTPEELYFEPFNDLGFSSSIKKPSALVCPTRAAEL